MNMRISGGRSQRRGALGTGCKLFILIALCAMLTRGAGAAPPYAVSGWIQELEQTTLADQSPLGPLSALDVLMYDQMNENQLAGVPVELLLEPSSLRAEPYRPAIERVINRMATAAVLADQTAWTPSQQVVRAACYGAAESIWLEDQVLPQVKVLPADINRHYLAHPELYLQRRQAQVRYIFRKLAPGSASAERQGCIDLLEKVARQVRGGQTTFEESARQVSQAASAAQGGLIPPFLNGTYFTAFEDAAFDLTQPDQVSAPFPGPGGYYLLQLVSSQPPRNIPIEEVQGQIRATLERSMPQFYYQHLLRKLLRKQHTNNYAMYWAYQDLSAPVARVNKTWLSREDYFACYGSPTGFDYQPRQGEVALHAYEWVEGETIMQQVEKLGLADHPRLQRARQLAAIGPRSRRACADSVSTDVYATTQTALSVLQQNPSFVRNLRDVVLLEIETAADSGKDLSQASERSALRLAQVIDAKIGAGTLPLEPKAVELAQWFEGDLPGDGDLTQAPADWEARLVKRIDQLEEDAEAMPWNNVQVNLNYIGLVQALPGTVWENLLADVSVGQVSAPLATPQSSKRYMVLAARPSDLTAWLRKPLHVRNLAFRAECFRQFEQTQKQIVNQQAVRLAF